MKSYFITGTDTDVGKTLITAGLSRVISNRGVDVGVMKPFAAAETQSSKFQSEDTEILAKASRVKDSEDLLNPEFFPIPASPYTASQNLGIDVDVSNVLEKFQALTKLHKVMLIEGIGGVMTPILQDYFVANLIQDMKLESIIITRSKIGTVNHTLLTCKICDLFKLPVKGIIINNYDTEGYPSKELKRDLENLTGIDVIGIIPRLESTDIDSVSSVIEENTDITKLIES